MPITNPEEFALLFGAGASMRDAFARAKHKRRELIHECPMAGTSSTPCCGRTVFELPANDRITSDSSQVTCQGRTRDIFA